MAGYITAIMLIMPALPVMPALPCGPTLLSCIKSNGARRAPGAWIKHLWIDQTIINQLIYNIGLGFIPIHTPRVISLSVKVPTTAIQTHGVRRRTNKKMARRPARYCGHKARHFGQMALHYGNKARCCISGTWHCRHKQGIVSNSGMFKRYKVLQS